MSESRKYRIWLRAFIVYEIVTFFAVLPVRSLRWQPTLLSWAAMDLPAALRILGAVLAWAALALFFWTHRALGSNLSATLRIRENHTLVTKGPYARIRHPMYSAFFLLHLAVFFLTANWFIGLTWMLGLSLVILLRIEREEAMLIEHFGDDYRRYMQRTRRFVPPLRWARLNGRG